MSGSRPGRLSEPVRASDRPFSSTPGSPLPNSTPYAPRHRTAPTQARRPASADLKRRVSRSTVILSTAVAATGLAVSAGVLKTADAMPHVSTMADGNAPADSSSMTLSEGDLARREAAPVVSRSDRRQAADPVKAKALGVSNGGAVSGRENLAQQDPQTIAAALLPQYGYDSSQMSCLIPLWTGESDWRVNAVNASSGAYGIPQSLPASKMATAGADYRTNPVTQIKWGLGYIRSSYGSPCGAYDFKQGHGWY